MGVIYIIFLFYFQTKRLWQRVCGPREPCKEESQQQPLRLSAAEREGERASTSMHVRAFRRLFFTLVRSFGTGVTNKKKETL